MVAGWVLLKLLGPQNQYFVNYLLTINQRTSITVFQKNQSPSRLKGSWKETGKKSLSIRSYKNLVQLGLALKVEILHKSTFTVWSDRISSSFF